MAAFQRPGESSTEAFGISFSADRDASSTAAPGAGTPLPQRRAAPDGQEPGEFARHQRAVLHAVEQHAVTILATSDAAGVAAHLLQCLHRAGWTAAQRQVACAHPQRVTTVNAAAAATEDLGCSVGSAVGYSISFEDIATPGVTCMRHVTDEVLVREFAADPLLSTYSVIAISDADQRTVSTDLLLALLEKVQRVRRDLRVVLVSTPTAAEPLRLYFAARTTHHAGASASPGAADCSPEPTVLPLQQESHPVQLHYLDEAASDFVRRGVETVQDIHRDGTPGDILLLLPGFQECNAAVRQLDAEANAARVRRSGRLQLLPVALHSGLSAAAQATALQPTPRGHRKVVAALDASEVGKALEGIAFVVDSMFGTLPVMDPFTGLEVLQLVPISQAAAVQRATAAGHMRAGQCFRLCTEEAYQQLPQQTVPEMARRELTGALLQLKALGVDSLAGFDFPAPPPPELAAKAVEALHVLEALDTDARLTSPVGEAMAALPLPPHLARALVAAGPLGCGDEVVTVCALLSIASVWVGASNRRRDLEEAKLRFSSAEGDLVSYLNVWHAWNTNGRSRHWAHRYCLNHRNLLRAADIRSQLEYRGRSLGLQLGSCDGDVDAVRKALAAGLLLNAARMTGTAVINDRDAGTHEYELLRPTGGKRVRLRMHASSVLHRVPAPWLVFNTATRSASDWFDMREVCTLQPEWLPELAPAMFSHSKPAIPA